MNYPAVAMTRTTLEAGERHLHSFRIRGWRYGIASAAPIATQLVGHFTDRRFVLESSAQEDAVVSIPWNEIIEFAQVGTEGSAAELPGAEEHMIHAATKKGPLLAIDDWLLFTAEPVEGGRPIDREAHCAAFVEIADELMVDAFESEEHVDAGEN